MSQAAEGWCFDRGLVEHMHSRGDHCYKPPGFPQPAPATPGYQRPVTEEAERTREEDQMIMADRDGGLAAPTSALMGGDHFNSP